MSHALVSILIPAYNAERWIGEALASALAQTWRHTEIIVVDDGSTDATATVVERLMTPRLKLIRQPNQGQSAAQNQALREAQGQFIQYLDADDLLSADKIERQMARLESGPDYIASGEWARFYGVPSEAVFVRERVWRDLTPEQWLVEAWTGGGGMMQAAIWLIPRPVAERAGPWDERLSLINDFEYFTRVLLASQGVRFSPGAKLYYRSGNPHSLASRRSQAAWRSALLSLELGTAALLQRTSTPEARRACADLFQRLVHEAYLEDTAVALEAERHAADLGGSSVTMDGGVLFSALRRTLGWRRAKRLKQVAYAIGYDHVAVLKGRTKRSAGG